ncbi:hypothetical protein EDE12_10352 [Methylosinus sp. sav-2]|nr:hypothetical protein EDE12_10352 [Methylosinus sp. sav-2]
MDNGQNGSVNSKYNMVSTQSIPYSALWFCFAASAGSGEERFR